MKSIQEENAVRIRLCPHTSSVVEQKSFEKRFSTYANFVLLAQNYATILPANGPGPMPAAASAAALPDQQQNLGPQTQPPGPHDPFLAQPFGDDPWMISSFFVPWDSMNF